MYTKTTDSLGSIYDKTFGGPSADAEIAAAGLFDLRLAHNDVESSFKMDAVETFVDYLLQDFFYYFSRCKKISKALVF